MSWQFNPYIVPLLGSALIILVLLWVTSRRAASASERVFLALVLAEFFWLITYAVELATADQPGILTWVKIEYVAIAIVPVLWLLFVLAYTNHRWALTPRMLVAWFAIPVLVIVAAWSNDLHMLFWAEPNVTTVDGLTLFEPVYGPLFWLHIGFSYLVTLAAAGLLLYTIARTPGVYRRQLMLLFACWALIFAANVLTVFDLGPAGLDLTPFGSALASVIVAWTLFRYRLFDLVPAAYDEVVRSMADGVLVFDGQERLLDFNPAAAHLFTALAPQTIGQPIARVFPDLPDVVRQYRELMQARGEVLLQDGDGDPGGMIDPEQVRHFDFQISPLWDFFGRPKGRVVVLRDITDLRLTELALERYREHLEDLVDQRTSELQATNEQLRAEVAERQRAEQELAAYQEQLETLVEERTLELELRNQELNAFTHTV
ncbi:MAG: PAS domain-containing protein, partial [Anaerolineae bacterium]|nr:PAS domain-containing protein [Anaerolineae bacterium]